jgi:RNA polymerase sigma-70 factor (ECF subfamily)
VRDPSEKPLVDALRRGDAAAFDVVYARYRGRILGFLLRLSRRRDVAEDLFQETFCKLARHAPKLAEDTDLAAWLFRVARNAWVSHRRWAMLDISRLAAFDEDALPAGPAVDAREVLLLVGVEGLDQEQAAAVLGISYEALRQRLSRARAQLADRLGMKETSEVPA